MTNLIAWLFGISVWIAGITGATVYAAAHLKGPTLYKIAPALQALGLL
jgi:hypothetical protein